MAETSSGLPSDSRDRNGLWVWWISVLLLLATMLNYMDRQTLAGLSKRIINELHLTRAQYGSVEFGFGWAFAAGSLFFGGLADRLSVRWLYPCVLLSWSAIGFVTGYCDDFRSLFWCRVLLGFFEAGHWPCALRTTQTLQQGGQRLMGNSILQSGGALGAILTPLVINWMVGQNTTAGAWRMPFLVIGSLGIVWAAFWMGSVRGDVLRAPDQIVDTDRGTTPLDWLFDCLSNRRFWALVPVVISLNITWQLIRAWLQMFLQEGRQVSEASALRFNSLYFVAADVGCLLAGVAALRLGTKGWSGHASRTLVFAACCALTALSAVAATLPAGPGLYCVLLLVAAGSLGLFPCYYSMAQEVSVRQLGKTSGLLGALGWLVASPLQNVFGQVVDKTKSYDLGLALVGFAPLLGLISLLLIWPKDERAVEVS